MIRQSISLCVVFLMFMPTGCSDDHDHDHDHGAQDTQTSTKADAGASASDAKAASTDAKAATGKIKLLVMGDSAMAWNEEKSTGHQVGLVLTEKNIDSEIKNNAVSGATLGCGENNIGQKDNCIPPQYEAGDWTHVLISGGANDIDAACEIKADLIISDDLKSGLMVEAVNKLTAAGHKVLLYRYFGTLDPQHPLNTCAHIKTMVERYKKLADSRDDVIDIDGGKVVQNTNAKLYAEDGIHPSPDGSRLIAEHIVKVLGY